MPFLHRCRPDVPVECSRPLPLQEPQRAAGSLQIRHTAARKGKGAAGQTTPEAQLEKKVVNCLACGKIYDCRSQEPTNDTLLFLGGCLSGSTCE